MTLGIKRQLDEDFRRSSNTKKDFLGRLHATISLTSLSRYSGRVETLSLYHCISALKPKMEYLLSRDEIIR